MFSLRLAVTLQPADVGRTTAGPGPLEAAPPSALCSFLTRSCLASLRRELSSTSPAASVPNNEGRGGAVNRRGSSAREDQLPARAPQRRGPCLFPGPRRPPVSRQPPSVYWRWFRFRRWIRDVLTCRVNRRSCRLPRRRRLSQTPPRTRAGSFRLS